MGLNERVESLGDVAARADGGAVGGGWNNQDHTRREKRFFVGKPFFPIRFLFFESLFQIKSIAGHILCGAGGARRDSRGGVAAPVRVGGASGGWESRQETVVKGFLNRRERRERRTAFTEGREGRKGE